MKSIHILIATSVLLILAISPVAAQGQGQTVRPEGDGTQQKSGQQDGQQTKEGYGREDPYERTYERPYERKKLVRPVITSEHMIGLDGGLDPAEAGFNGGNNQPAGAPANNWFGGGGNVAGNGGVSNRRMSPFSNTGNGNTGNGNGRMSPFSNTGNGNTNTGPRVSVVNGVRTIEVEESSRKIKIIEDPQKGIYIEITKQYGPKELASLKNRMPDLGEYIDLFPEQLNNSDIELTIGVTSKYSAANAADLERQDQGAYNVYRRFANAQSNNGQSANFQQLQPQGPMSRYWGPKRPANLPSAALSGGGATGR
jgi:hypothetical protein